MFCTHCGSELREGTHFCTNCGKELNKPRVATASSQAETTPPRTQPLQPLRSKLFPGIPVGCLIVILLALARACSLANQHPAPSAAHQCQSLTDAKDYKAALTACNEAVQADSTDSSSYQHRCAVKRNLRDDSGAITDCSEAIGLDSTNTDAFNERCLAHEDRGDFQAALSDCNVVISQRPSDESGWNNRCMVNADLGNLKAAVNDCGRALSQQPGDGYALGNLCSVEFQMGNATKAINDCRASLKTLPGRYEVFGTICAAENTLPNVYPPAARISDCGSAIGGNPHRIAAALSNRCEAYFDAKQYTLALADCDKAVRLAPNEPEAYAGRAVLNATLGRRSEAISDLWIAAKLFKQKGDLASYQQTISTLREIQP